MAWIAVEFQELNVSTVILDFFVGLSCSVWFYKPSQVWQSNEFWLQKHNIECCMWAVACSLVLPNPCDTSSIVVALQQAVQPD